MQSQTEEEMQEETMLLLTNFNAMQCEHHKKTEFQELGR
jgi:hypothetical protein